MSLRKVEAESENVVGLFVHRYSQVIVRTEYIGRDRACKVAAKLLFVCAITLISVF